MADELVIYFPVISSSFEVKAVNVASTFPVITANFGATGAYAGLVVEMPWVITQFTAAGPRCVLDVDLPALEAALFGGAGLDVDTTVAEALFTAVVGATGGYYVDLPPLDFDAASGAKFEAFVPAIGATFSGTTGSVASFVVDIPAVTALIEGRTGHLGVLDIQTPLLQILFTASHPALGVLSVDLPALQVAMAVSGGEVAQLLVSTPALDALLSGYVSSSSILACILPAIQAILAASQTGRFDTSTAAGLEATILKYVRPV